VELIATLMVVLAVQAVAVVKQWALEALLLLDKEMPGELTQTLLVQAAAVRGLLVFRPLPHWAVTAALVVQAAFLEHLPTMLAVAAAQTTVLLVLKVALAVQAVAVMVTTEQLRVRLVQLTQVVVVAVAARLEQQATAVPVSSSSLTQVHNYLLVAQLHQAAAILFTHSHPAAL